MADEANLILQLARDSVVDRNLSVDPPLSLVSGRVVLDYIAPGELARLGLTQAGEVIMSVLSPEALARESQQIRDVIRQAPATDQPLVIVVQAAEQLREDELGVVADAAARAHRLVILRVMMDS
jgi:hypothetical protein